MSQISEIYEMTILARNSKAFKKTLQEKYSEKISIEKEVPTYPYMIYHLHTKDISRRELALIQDQFLV